MSLRFNARLFALLLTLTAFAAMPAIAQDTATCSRDEVSNLIESGASQSDIDAYLADCQAQPQPVEGPAASPYFEAPLKQTITNTGSVFYETLSSCGYHPQRREFACTVELRQRFGFGGFPAVGPGSFEWTLACVDYGAGLVPVNVSAVHVHDEPFGNPPNWYYSTVIQADDRLHRAAVNGQTLGARVILAWSQIPNNCNFNPIWGAQADFRIKLDP